MSEELYYNEIAGKLKRDYKGQPFKAENFRLTEASRVRLIGPTGGRSVDIIQDRLNVVVDENNIITDFFFG